jgi:hypothetical protein
MCVCRAVHRLAALAWIAGCGRVDFSARATIDAPDDVTAPDAADPLMRDCVLHMAMDEAAWSGTAADVIDSCGHHDGTAVNAAAVVDDPVRGRVGNFPDPASCVEVPDAPDLRPTTGLTVSAWVKPMALDGSNAFGIVSKRDDYLSNAAYTVFAWTNDMVWADIDTENDRAPGGTALVNGEWHHVTVVFDGTLSPPARVQFYYDARPDGSITESSTSITQFTSNLAIGCMPLPTQPADQQSLRGELDDVAIWTRALAAGEVTSWYERTKR